MLRNLDTQNVELTTPQLNVSQLLKLRGSLEQLGVKIPFSESANFTKIHGKLDLRLNEIMQRWLQEFDITITYKSGRKHHDADYQSRTSVESAPMDTDDDEDIFRAALDVMDMTALQRRDPELSGS